MSKMQLDSMSGSTRKLSSVIEPYQEKFIKWALPKLPRWIETYHLTLLTIPFSLLLIISAKVLDGNRIFLLVHAALIFFQYISDILDGSLGRYRNTGLIRWGFYMDHFLDYIFAISAVLSYGMYFHISSELTAIMIGLVGAYFTNEFIIGNVKGMVNTSGYYGFGPSEARFAGILINIVMFLVNYTPSEQTIIYIVGSLIIAFIYVCWKTQKSLWIQDMAAKEFKKKKR